VSNFKRDRYVLRLKRIPPGAYRAPRIRYCCDLCHNFQTFYLTRAWAHSQMHGPWPEEGSQVAHYVLNLSAQAAGMDHPRGHV